MKEERVRKRDEKKKMRGNKSRAEIKKDKGRKREERNYRYRQVLTKLKKVKKLRKSEFGLALITGIHL